MPAFVFCLFVSLFLVVGNLVLFLVFHLIFHCLNQNNNNSNNNDNNKNNHYNNIDNDAYVIPASPKISVYWKRYIVSGFIGGAYLMILSYCLIHERTPILLVEIAFQISFLWGIPTTILVFGSHHFRSLCRWRPLISLNLMLWGIVFCIVPTILNTISAHPNISPLSIACCVFINMALFLRALYNVLQEQFLKERKDFIDRSACKDLLCFNLFSSIFQFFAVLFLFWIQLLSPFGSSTSVPNFISNLSQTMKSFWSVERSIVLVVFFFSFFGRLLFSSFLNSSSSTFVNMLLVLGVTFTKLIWLPAKQFAPEDGIPQNPYWNVLSAMFMIGGVVLWRSWETQKKRLTFLQPATPSYDYFDEGIS